MRIGSLGQLSADQLRIIRQLGLIGQAIDTNNQRLSTLRRINSAKDDPTGLVAATSLEADLTTAQATSSGIAQAGGIVGTASVAAGEIVDQLQAARSLVLEAAGGSLTSSELAAHQISLDTILRGIDTLSRTEYDGRRLLDGSASFESLGVDTTKIADVDVLTKQSDSDLTVNVNVTVAATKAANSYTGGVPVADTTLVVTGKQGSTTISFDAGTSLADIAGAFNDASYLTGVSAVVNGGNIDLSSVDYGSNAKIAIDAASGSFALSTSGEVSGTDATATINGQTFTGDGSRFNVNLNQAAFVLDVKPTVSGAINPFVISGKGYQFLVGTDPASTARLGMPSLSTATLGGVAGSLSTLVSGGGNELTGGHAATALRIIDEALGDAVLGQAQVDSFQKYTLDSSSRVLSGRITNLNAALSSIRDTNVSIESALLTNNQLLQQSALQALASTNLSQRDVLSLLLGR